MARANRAVSRMHMGWLICILIGLTLNMASATGTTPTFKRATGIEKANLHNTAVNSLRMHIEEKRQQTPQFLCRQFRLMYGISALSDEEIMTCLQCSGDFDIPIELALAVMEKESHFDRDAVGPDGHDFGYFQIRQSNHAWLKEQTGEDPMDPVGNIICGFWLLRYDMDLGENDPRVALTIYRWGHDNGNRAYATAVLKSMDEYVAAAETAKRKAITATLSSSAAAPLGV